MLWSIFNQKNYMAVINKKIRHYLWVTILLGLFACSTVTAPKPKPIADHISLGKKITVAWSVSKLSSSLAGSFVPAFDNNAIFTADSDGDILRLDNSDGMIIKKFALKRQLSSGTAVSSSSIFVTTLDAHLIAVNKFDGKVIWQSPLSTIAVEAPQVAADIVVVKTNDGQLSAYDAGSGKLLWVYQKNNPPLTLRAYNSFQIIGHEVVVVGEASGRLALVNLMNGSLLWDMQLAMSHGSTDLEKLTDIGMRPTLYNKTVCVAAYAGKIGCLDVISSRIIWTKDFSSTQGVLIDMQNVYTIDEDGVVYAFDRATGATVWKNDELKYRKLGVPSFLQHNILVIDQHGYINVFDHSDGKLITRRPSNLKDGTSYPFFDNNQVIIQSGNGHIARIY